MIDNNELQKKLYNKDFRKKLIVNPEKHLTELGYKLRSGAKVKVVKSSKDIFYLSVDSRDDIDISEIQAAIGSSTVGTIGTVGSVSSLCSCESTMGTVGSVGSASTIDVK